MLLILFAAEVNFPNKLHAAFPVLQPSFRSVWMWMIGISWSTDGQGVPQSVV